MYAIDALPSILASDLLASTCLECVNPATSHVVGFRTTGCSQRRLHQRGCCGLTVTLEQVKRKWVLPHIDHAQEPRLPRWIAKTGSEHCRQAQETH